MAYDGRYCELPRVRTRSSTISCTNLKKIAEFKLNNHSILQLFFSVLNGFILLQLFYVYNNYMWTCTCKVCG